MIQLSNNIAMFAAFRPRTRHIIKCDGLFYGHSGTLYPNDIRLSNPHGLLSHDSSLFLVERGEGNLSLFITLCNISFMTKNNEICNAGNNSTRTATSAHETSKYSTSELQAAYDVGRAIGRTEGMIAYQKHLIENIQKENVKLTQKLDLQKEEAAV